MTLACIGLQEAHTDLTVDYFLHRIHHPQNQFDPFVLPRFLLALLHRTERADEVRGAAAGAMEGMPAGAGAGLLLGAAVNAYDDDLYLRLFRIATRRKIIEEDFRHDEIGYRRLALREHPWRKPLRAERR